MTVLVMVALFAVFLAADAVIRRRQLRREIRREEARRERARRRLALRTMNRMPPRLFFHPGHIWARPVGDGLVRVGLDRFGARLLGAPDRVRLPGPGDVLQAGEAAFSLVSGPRTARLVAPVSGEVVAVNEALARWPWLVQEDPMGHGWLVEIRAPAAGTDLSDLLDLVPEGPAERNWDADERMDLAEHLAALESERHGARGGRQAVAADGGMPVEGFAERLSPGEWERLAHRFFRAAGATRQPVEERT